MYLDFFAGQPETLKNTGTARSMILIRYSTKTSNVFLLEKLLNIVLMLQFIITFRYCIEPKAFTCVKHLPFCVHNGPHTIEGSQNLKETANLEQLCIANASIPTKFFL